MKALLILGVAGLIFGAVMMRKRGRAIPVETIHRKADDVFVDLEHRVAELRDEAKRVTGEAKQKLQNQARELETQQHELRKRLNDDAHKLLERAKSRSAA